MLDILSSALPRRLAAHLATLDLPQGAHLSEQALADSMAVSRSPIRRVLAEFARAGIVVPRPRRGYVLAMDSRALFTSRFEFAVEDGDGLFDRIALDRLSGHLADDFTVETVARCYGVSASLALRTLNALRDEAVVEPAGRGRWRFHPSLLTREASDLSYAFRLVIEPPIPLLPTFAPRPDLLRQCRDEHLRLLDLPASERVGRLAYRVDAMFHECIALCGNNPFVHASVVQQGRLRQLLEYRNATHGARLVAWVREHLDILDAITANDRPAASRLIERHLHNAQSAPPSAIRSAA